MPSLRTPLSLVLACLFSFSLPVRADDRVVTINDDFFDGVPVAANAKVLVVSVDPKALTHGDADAELIQYPSPGAERQPNSCGLDSTPPVPFTLDCGAKMLGVESHSDSGPAVYYFLLKAQQGDWYQVIVSPQSGATFWTKDPHENGFVMTAYSLTDWLFSEDSFVIAAEMADPSQTLLVMSKPNDRSDVLTECVGYEDGDGLIPTDKTLDGDWIHVACLENDCYTPKDPLNACTPLRNTHETPCSQGWARWRSQEGHLLVYPHQALPDGC
jgi:hypothetical protein